MKEENKKFIEMVVIHLDKFYPSISKQVATFIACQFALESDFGRSNIAKKQFNFCGMKFPRVRVTTSYKESSLNGFACYYSFDDCLFDYVLWLQYQRPLRSELENVNLFQSISRKYCPDEDYNIRIINLLNQYQNGKD